jgi:uncharacterized phage protein (TIGR02218 family)
MRDWSPTLVSMLQSDEVTRCFLIQLVSPIKGTVRMTDWDADQTVSAASYVSSPGFSVTKWTVANGGRPAGIDLTLPFDDVGPLLADDIKRGAWRGATITVWLANAVNPSDREIIVDGFIGKTQFTDRLVGSIEVTTKGDALADIFLLTVQPKCSFQFGGTQCGVDLAPITLTATVATVTDTGKFTITVTNPDSLDFTHGKVAFTSGANDGYEDWARRWTSGTSLVELVNGSPFDIQVGDTLTISEGCDLSRSGPLGCKHHNNVNRFPGQDYTPAELQGSS